MKISYTWLQTYFDQPLPDPTELAQLFNTHAFEVEGVEKVDSDTVLDIKVLPDRAHYALCHRGIAREVQAITGMAIINTDAPTISIDTNIKTPVVSIDPVTMCKRYILRRIDGVKIAATPAHVVKKLEAVGQRSINTIVDATNYVMLDIGQPLHAFDADLVEGSITIRMAQDGEKLILLDGREVALISSDVVIADEKGVLALAGVKGGKRAEVTTHTTSIILESACFDPVLVRKTATRLNLRNDASKRFENEITPDLAREAMDVVTSMIRTTSGGAASDVNDIYPNPVRDWAVSVDTAYIQSLIGVAISVSEITSILMRMNCKVAEQGGRVTVTPPHDRLDLIIPEDIADEVGRMYGYDKLVSVLPPKLTTEFPTNKAFFYGEKVKNLLIEKGFSETLLYTLVPKGFYEIAYPLASDKAALRESSRPKLIDALILNTRNADILELDKVCIFEIGKIFPKTGEHTSLSLGATIVVKKKGITAESLVRDAVITLEKTLGVSITEKIQTTNNNQNITTATIEIDFDALIHTLPEQDSISELNFKALPPETTYKAFSPYPFSSRDVAVFVPTQIPESHIAQLITTHAGKYLVRMRLFDVFNKKDEAGVEKTSYAYRLVFQSFEKTLEESEINTAMTNITNTLNAQEGWKVR